ncbi:MAG: hypothetical protein UH853_10070 [Muribaculaceae bacterium]|nr:hypothetical protein [Muribaculaceae bacterium]
MADKKSLSLEERLIKIVNVSYEILCNKIVCGGIEVPNEASLQMQLGVILKQVGQLYEFSNEEHFSIDLESPQDIKDSPKSNSNKARCDIFLKLTDIEKEISAAIEIKHLKQSKNEAVTDNRFSVLLDLKNLELYKSNYENLLSFEIVYTNNINYTLPERSKIELSGKIQQKEPYCGNFIELDNTHEADWDKYNKEKHYFLKIGF